MALGPDGTLWVVTGLALAIFLVMFVMRALRQPHVISYILVGVLLGPSLLGVIDDPSSLSSFGDLGIILLLFFVGMHIELPKLVRSWRVAIIGTGLQIAASICLAWLLGYFLAWPFERILLLGFVISLSSTAVLLKLLESWGELDTRVGQDVLSILLVQDVAIVGMLLTLSFLSPGAHGASDFILPGVGGVLIVALMAWILYNGGLRFSFPKLLRGDHELEVFAALILCFGVALLTGLFGLSTALGAFVAGIVLGAARETEWVKDHLYPLQVIFVALFFVYVGLLLDLAFVAENLWLVLGFTVLVLLTNTVLNAAILRSLGRRWRNAVYGGALLSQIGEFSFLLAAVGLQSGFITGYGYQLTLAIIALGLLLTPGWLFVIKKLVKPVL